MEPREGGVTPLDRWPLSVQKVFSGLSVLQIYVFPLVVPSCILKAQLRQDVVCVMISSVVMKWLVFKGETKAHLDSMKLDLSSPRFAEVDLKVKKLLELNSASPGRRSR